MAIHLVEIDLIKKLERFREIGSDALTLRREIWADNLLFYLGDQWDKAEKDKRATWRALPVFNVILQTVELLHSLVTDQRPVGFAYARGRGTQTIANLLTQMIESLHTDLHIERKDSQKWKHKFFYGTGFWKTTWSKEDDEVVTEKLAPNTIIPDPLAVDIQDCRYIIEEKVRAISDVIDEFPDKIDEILRSKDRDITTIIEQATGEFKTAATVLVKQCWFLDTAFEDETDLENDNPEGDLKKRKRKYPRGRVVTWVGDVILSDVKNPYKFKTAGGNWPYSKDVLIEIPDEFWGASIIDIMKRQQQEVNELEAMIFDSIKTVINPLYVSVKGMVDVDTFSTAPGALIEEDEPNSFRREPGQNIPSDAFRFRDIKVDELKSLTGVTDALQGATGPSQRPGAVRASFEASMTRLREMIRNNNRALADTSERQIDIMRQFYKAGRIVSVAADGVNSSEFGIESADPRVIAAFEDPKVQRELRAGRQQRELQVESQEFKEAVRQQEQASGQTDTKLNEKAVLIKGILQFKNDINIGAFGYRVDIHSLALRDPETMRNLVIDLLRYGEGVVVDAKAVHDLLDLPGKAGIIERIDQVNQLKEQNKILTDQLAGATGGQGGQPPSTAQAS